MLVQLLSFAIHSSSSKKIQHGVRSLVNMDLTGIPTPCLDWTSTNLVDSWKKFQQHVQLIFDGPLKDKDETVKISYLLIWVGDKGRDVYNTWTLTNDEKKKLDTYYQRFKAYVQPKLNPVFSRFKFNNEVQGQQSIEQFVTRLRLLAKDCQYNDADEMIRDRIVFGTNSAKIREKLINEGEKLTLDKAIQIAQNYEYSQEQLKSMGTTSQEVHAVTSRSGNRDSRRMYKTGHSTRQPEPRLHSDTSSSHASSKPECSNCGYKHTKKEKCPAYGKTCKLCSKRNHFARVCRGSKKVHEVCDPHVTGAEYPLHSTSDNFTDLFVDCINSVHVVSKPDVLYDQNQAFTNVTLGPNKVPVKCKLDTGSQVNVIPISTYKQLGITDQLSPSSDLSGYAGSPLRTLGSCKVAVGVGDKVFDTYFHVVDPDGRHAPPILGLSSCMTMGFVKFVNSVTVNSSITDSSADSVLDRETVLTQFKDVFEGLGLFPGECTIHVDFAVHPRVGFHKLWVIGLRLS